MKPALITDWQLAERSRRELLAKMVIPINDNPNYIPTPAEINAWCDRGLARLQAYEAWLHQVSATRNYGVAEARGLGRPVQLSLPCFTCHDKHDDSSPCDCWECPDCGAPRCEAHTLTNTCAFCHLKV